MLLNVYIQYYSEQLFFQFLLSLFIIVHSVLSFYDQQF